MKCLIWYDIRSFRSSRNIKKILIKKSRKNLIKQYEKIRQIIINIFHSLSFSKVLKKIKIEKNHISFFFHHHLENLHNFYPILWFIPKRSSSISISISTPTIKKIFPTKNLPNARYHSSPKSPFNANFIISKQHPVKHLMLNCFFFSLLIQEMKKVQQWARNGRIRFKNLSRLFRFLFFFRL